MLNINKSAKNFIKKLKGAVSFETIQGYLQTNGYTVIYYTAPECSALFEKYDLSDFAKTVPAFTFVCDSVKLVFVNDTLPLSDMTSSLVHEAAHIFLGHLSRNQYTTDDRQNEMEAEALAYAVLSYKKSYKPYIITALVMIILLFVPVIYNLTAPKVITPTSESIITSTDETVYLTPTGSKFHRRDCRYIKNKDCTPVLKNEAQQNYSPCKICIP